MFEIRNDCVDTKSLTFFSAGVEPNFVPTSLSPVGWKQSGLIEYFEYLEQRMTYKKGEVKAALG